MSQHFRKYIFFFTNAPAIFDKFTLSRWRMRLVKRFILRGQFLNRIPVAVQNKALHIQSGHCKSDSQF